MSEDNGKTILGLRKLARGEKLSMEEELALENRIRRNSLVSKIIIWLAGTAITVIIGLYITKFIG